MSITNKISIIIPVYNEEEVIKDVIQRVINFLNKYNYENEIIVVNDGSTDKTGLILENFKNLPNLKIIIHPYNKGYGASLKTGARVARYDWLLFFDGDGQHQIDYLNEFVKYTDKYEMIVGSRQGYLGPFLRQPGKKILHWIANYLVEKKIPDINCGFRLIKKEFYLKYLHILPNTFSASTTITLIFFKEGLNVKYLPVKINKRLGQSTVRPRDAAKTLLLILRVIMLFNPLKVFMPISFLFFCLGILIFFSQLIYLGDLFVSKSVSLLILSSIFLFSFGLLADQIASIRRESK